MNPSPWKGRAADRVPPIRRPDISVPIGRCGSPPGCGCTLDVVGFSAAGRSTG